MISTERLREILAGTEGVTPGPYHGGGFAVYADTHSRHRVCVLHTGVVGNPPSHAPTDEINAAHFRRLDPDTVKALVTELLALRGASQ